MSKASSNAVVSFRRGAAADPTLPAILEFQWPSTAIVNAPVPRMARGIIWIVASLVFVVIATLALIPVDRVVATRGAVVSKSPTILVQPLETAIVRSIDVHEGQEVKAGELLARLDPTFASADLATLTSQVSSLEAEVARLRAEAGGLPFTYSGDDPNWILQASIFGHRQAQFESKIENYAHRLAELDTIIVRSKSDATAYRERLGLAQDVEQMRKTLEARQAGSRLNTLLAMDSRAEMARALMNAEQTAKGAELDREALASDRDAFVRGWRGDASQQLSAAAEKASNAHEQLNKAKLRRELVEFRSEHDAIVQSVAKVSVGSVLQSGQQFITLVPGDAILEIEANISGAENGFVHLGDQVSIKFDTFPYTQYGVAEGVVKIVSPNSFAAQDEARNPTGAAPATPTSSEPFYRTRIAIKRLALHDTPAGFHIVPGMPVTADIKVGKRTVLQYLFGLVAPVANEAMREP